MGNKYEEISTHSAPPHIGPTVLQIDCKVMAIPLAAALWCWSCVYNLTVHLETSNNITNKKKSKVKSKWLYYHSVILQHEHPSYHRNLVEMKN